MQQMNRSSQEHAALRYMCVTVGVIDKLQRDYFAGRDLGRSVPHMDATKAAVIVSESSEADRISNNLLEILSGEYPHTPESLSDWSLAVLVDLFFSVADVARERKDRERTQDYWALAWATLERVLNSPTASPMLLYEDIFFDVGQELRMRGERQAIGFSERALAHNLRHNQGDRADALLSDLAETHLWVDELDKGLSILAALLRNRPADVWTYNSMAISFDHFGLTELGAEAT